MHHPSNEFEKGRNYSWPDIRTILQSEDIWTIVDLYTRIYHLTS